MPHQLPVILVVHPILVNLAALVSLVVRLVLVVHLFLFVHPVLADQVLLEHLVPHQLPVILVVHPYLVVLVYRESLDALKIRNKQNITSLFTCLLRGIR